nr:Rpn family recombination-promoting nuclease/putative transposase [Rickettsia conorii]
MESASDRRPRHDTFIRKALENPIVAREFFEMHLPKEIKALFSPHTLKIEKESFVEPTLRLMRVLGIYGFYSSIKVPLITSWLLDSLNI